MLKLTRERFTVVKGRCLAREEGRGSDAGFYDDSFCSSIYVCYGEGHERACYFVGGYVACRSFYI